MVATRNTRNTRNTRDTRGTRGTRDTRAPVASMAAAGERRGATHPRPPTPPPPAPVLARRQRSGDQAPTDSRVTITLRSSIRGLRGLVISIPRLQDRTDDESQSVHSSDTVTVSVEDASYVTETETESESESTEDSLSLAADAYIPLLTIQKSNMPPDDCPICLESFRLRQHAKRLPCGHTFHKNCIQKWLRRSPCCPVCRSELAQPVHERLLPTSRQHLRDRIQTRQYSRIL